MKFSAGRSPLAVAAQLAAKTRQATTERDDAIHAATRSGFTLREIGEATELSHTTVKRIIDRYSTPDEEDPMKDEWTKYKSRYSQRLETFDAYVDVWQRIPKARSAFSGWASFTQAANAEPAQNAERVRAAEECMRDGGYRLGALTKRGARSWNRA